MHVTVTGVLKDEQHDLVVAVSFFARVASLFFSLLVEDRAFLRALAKLIAPDESRQIFSRAQKSEEPARR